MKKLFTLLLVIGLVFSAFAADFTITLNARLSSVLQKVASDLTIQRGTNVTVEAYLTEVIRKDLREQAAQQEAVDLTPVVRAWENATPAQRAAAKTALGIP